MKNKKIKQNKGQVAIMVLLVSAIDFGLVKSVEYLLSLKK